MKFLINKSDFLEVLSQVESIISSKEIKSIISSILIETTKDQIILTSTDLEIGIRSTAKATIEQEGAIVVPAKKLSQSIKEFRGTSIDFQVDDKNITIKDSSGISKAIINIVGNSSEEYPPISKIPDKEYVSFPAQIILDMIKKTSYAIADEDARYVFNGLFLKTEDNILNVVATDGRRLSVISKLINEKLPCDDGLIIPNKTVRELQKILNTDGNGFLAYRKNEKQIYFKIKNLELSSKLIDGQFPDYNQVIPKSHEYHIKINKALFEGCIKQVAVMASEPTRLIVLTFTKDTLNISAATPDLGKAEDTISIEYSGEDQTLAYNSVYLMDVLKVIHSDEITLSLTSSNTPSIIKDSQNKDFISVIMPIKV